MTDPFAPVTSRRFLHRLNPLAVVAAVAPAVVVLVAVRDLATPLVLLVLATALLLAGARVPARRVPLAFGLPVGFTLLAAVSFGLWADPDAVPGTATLIEAGSYRFTVGSWLAGLGISLRLGALLAVVLVPGFATTGPDLVRAAVQNLRVPYRIGYTAFAAFRFVPRFGHELAVIRAAHRVRGVAGGRGPLAGPRRWAGVLVPLLAGAIRHAERVALAMDARAFGAHATRTERYLVPFRVRDGVFVAVCWAVTVAVTVFAQPVLGLPEPVVAV
ncbi:energy-coupling factor transporter transmembrane component T [Myceligenerans xiligouense]|uniref:Energy-coupling factor transport system permease protein n=1 Tax=Myceligenerans xiligouense TaxID=253184 RepID=A0A3N4Z6A1_9MICO|nr:energy-coupling factor transporter transmembrane component T [Myceligenerans xiligouense]RPF21358.1 energy-coupling factor transport system permease protein [Myceligenerans xiligouense]